MKNYTITPIGFVKNSFKNTVGFHEIKNVMREVSIIEILDEYAEGLFQIEKEEFLNIIFYFDRSEGYKLICNTPLGEEKGVFVCRSPKRPNSLGTTTVKLIKREKNKLYVTGLDAIDNTPVIDIKNANSFLVETHPTYIPRYKENPRIDIENLLDKEETKALLIKSAQLHNHFCPNLALGVMASVLAMSTFKKNNSWKNIKVRTNSQTCYLDGIQFITGCSLSNQSLTLEDEEEFFIAIETKTNQRGVLLKIKNKNLIEDKIPKFHTFCQKFLTHQLNADEKEKILKATFQLLEIPAKDIFEINEY
ncbi:MAG: tRNA (N6-threonylcarbamoyladenosine(37)-N6)-methyltransferase TrmO [Flavobacteriaceae bacterium]|nr:tRNA (N6-threonylcarbamoyladenosine(37)-N6)-methyltransferase TrmO [Flavobacteriaceae bacterium]